MKRPADTNLIKTVSKKALSAVLAACVCFYMCMIPSRPVFAEEEQPAASEEYNNDNPKDQESKKEPEENRDNAKSAPEQKSGSEAPSGEPEKQPADKKEDKQEEKPEDSEEKPEEKPGEGEEKPEEKPEENPGEKPAETPSETPSENPGENPGQDPSENPVETPGEIPSGDPDTEHKYSLSGKAYIQTVKNKKGTFKDGILTLGKKGKRLESFSISLKNETGYEGSITYRAYIRKKGWSKWASSGKTVGTKNKKLRIEAVQIKLTGEIAKHYFVEYKASISSLSDRQGWVHNAAIGGTRNNGRRIEELQVRLVPVESNDTSSVIYRLRGQTYGWQKTWSKDGEASGTFSKRLEAITIALGPSKYLGGITYRSFVQGSNWTDWVSNGSISGKNKTGKRLEALQIKLTGEMAEHYDVYYRVYIQSFGWLGWAQNGQSAGSRGTFRRIEKIQIVLREKDAEKPGDEDGIISVKPHAYYAVSNTNAIMTYKNILDCGYTDPDVFRAKLIKNFEYMKDVGYFHMGKMIQGYTDCAGSVSLAFRVALGTAKFTKKYKKGNRKDGSQLYGIGVNYCGIKSYKDKYGWCRNGTASVNSHFLNTIVKNRKIKYTQISLSDRSDGEKGWSNDEWVDYLKETGAKPGDVFVWFNHDWSKKKGQHMTMFAGIGEDGIAYEWTASSTYGVILSPLWDRTPQGIFESFTLMKGVADLTGYC